MAVYSTVSGESHREEDLVGYSKYMGSQKELDMTQQLKQQLDVDTLVTHLVQVVTEIKEQLTDAVVMPPKIKMENLSTELGSQEHLCVSADGHSA